MGLLTIAKMINLSSNYQKIHIINQYNVLVELWFLAHDLPHLSLVPEIFNC